MRILFLDDDRSRIEKLASQLPNARIEYVTNRNEFKNAIASDVLWDYIMLDHDISDDFNGNDAAKMLTDDIWKTPGYRYTVIIHSTNPRGAAQIALTLSNCDHIQTYIIPEFWTIADENMIWRF